MKRVWVLMVMWVAGGASAWGHVGSKDVFETVHAGGYTLYVTVRPPNVIPGVATVEVKSSGAAITALTVTPLPVTGEASKHPPAADGMKASAVDPAFYTGAVWIMGGGTWQVRFEMDGAAGKQVASVPLVAVPISVLRMGRGMGFALGALGLFLLVAMAGVVGASVREARLRPGVEPTPALGRRGWMATAGSVAAMAAIVLLGGWWWSAEAAGYAENIFSAAPATAKLQGDQLDLMVAKIASDTRHRGRSNSDYLSDHGHLIHLYAIREPEMDAAFHLHPEMVAAGDFRMDLPAMPAGHYKLYGDVVHKSGLAETLVSAIDVPEGMHGGALAAEDASAVAAPVSQGELGSAFKLPDGYSMVWDKPATLTAGTAYTFRYRLVDGQGKPAEDMQPYLGMAGHAAFVKTDGTVFAHTHPEGSAAMPDVMLAEESSGVMKGMETAPVSAEVGFPYGFPTAGRYRIFVQMKHAGTVETGVFDAEVK